MDLTKITLPRDIVTHWLWQQPRKFKMWLTMILMASELSHTEVIGNKTYRIERGQFAITMKSLAARLECSKQTLLTFISRLEECGMIKRERPSERFSIITIIGSEEYFGTSETSELAECSNLSKNDNKPQELTKGESTGNAAETSTSIAVTKLDANEFLPRAYSFPIVYNNNYSSSTARVCTREENLKFFEELRNSDSFWEDLSKGLGIPLNQVKVYAEESFHEFLTKGKLKSSREEVQSLLFNWIRSKIENKNRNYHPSDKLQRYANRTQSPQISNSFGGTNFDPRRGVDAPPRQSSNNPKKRFTC